MEAQRSPPQRPGRPAGSNAVASATGPRRTILARHTARTPLATTRRTVGSASWRGSNRSARRRISRKVSRPAMLSATLPLPNTQRTRDEYEPRDRLGTRGSEAHCSPGTEADPDGHDGWVIVVGEPTNSRSQVGYEGPSEIELSRGAVTVPNAVVVEPHHGRALVSEGARHSHQCPIPVGRGAEPAARNEGNCGSGGRDGPVVERQQRIAASGGQVDRTLVHCRAHRSDGAPTCAASKCWQVRSTNADTCSSLTAGSTCRLHRTTTPARHR